jgi:hypothetical protein
MAGIEWALPTVVVAYLLKPFFEVFLQEAGKDLYLLTKSNLKKFIVTNRELKTKLISARQSTEKLSKRYDQSLTVSLKANLHPNLRVTILISENINDKEIDNMLEGMFEVLAYLYAECKKHDDNSQTRYQNDLFLISNNLIKQWELLDRRQMGERYRNKL